MVPAHSSRFALVAVFLAVVLLAASRPAHAAPIALDATSLHHLEDSIALSYEAEPLGYDPDGELYFWLGRIAMPSYLLHVQDRALYTFDLMLERPATHDGALAFDPGLGLLVDPDAHHAPPAWGWGTPIATVLDPGYYRIVPGLFFLLRDEVEQQRQALVAVGRERPPLAEQVPFSLVIAGESIPAPEPGALLLFITGLGAILASRRPPSISRIP